MSDEASGLHAGVTVGDLSMKVALEIQDMKTLLTRSVDTAEKLWSRLQFGTPIKYRRAVSATAPASGQIVLDLGTPDSGTWWDVESCVVGGTDYTATSPGTAGLYVSAQVQGRSPGLSELVDIAQVLPNRAFYGHRDIVVQEREHLIVVINSATAGDVYIAAATVTSYNVAGALGNQITAAGA
jgi:hypothetical protein